jgi:hypothetical protein
VSRDTAPLFSRTFGTRWGGGSAPRPGRLYSPERPGTHCTGCTVCKLRKNVKCFILKIVCTFLISHLPATRPDQFIILNSIALIINEEIKPLNADLNLICHLLTLLGAHHILHVSGIRVTLRSSRGLIFSLLPLLPFKRALF